MPKKIEGIVPPVVTPLNAYGSLDCQALVRHHEYLLENGVQKMYTYYDALVEEENRRRHEAEGKSE